MFLVIEKLFINCVVNKHTSKNVIGLQNMHVVYTLYSFYTQNIQLSRIYEYS